VTHRRRIDGDDMALPRFAIPCLRSIVLPLLLGVNSLPSATCWCHRLVDALLPAAAGSAYLQFHATPCRCPTLPSRGRVDDTAPDGCGCGAVAARPPPLSKLKRTGQCMGKGHKNTFNCLGWEGGLRTVWDLGSAGVTFSAALTLPLYSQHHLPPFLTSFCYLPTSTDRRCHFGVHRSHATCRSRC